jgi:hypothetical protein
MAMTFPLYPHGLFGTYAGLLVGTLVGVAFGFVLERAGFGRARNLAAQFYLTDTRVLKVMFSAIVTALAGMALLAGVGILDLSLITVPETFLWPQLVGGLLLGAGFIVSGYCPGTGVVAIASGNLDGIAAIGGVMLGSLFFGFSYGPLESFYKSGAMGVVRLQDLLGVPIAVVAAGVIAMAIGAFVGGEKLEKIFTKKAGEKAPDSPRTIKVRVFGGLAAAAALAIAILALPIRARGEATRTAGSMSASALARQLVTSPQGVWLLDVRATGVAAQNRIPGAFALPQGDEKAEFAAALSPTRPLVVYAQRDLAELPEGVRRFPGDVVVLRGGYDAWQAAILTPPVPPENPTPVLIAEFRLTTALQAHFTGGAAVEPPKVELKPAAAAAAGPKKGGGC